ncbi:MAG: AtpZ/AtpI family protein [Candidatus Magasanikbacteria bacterium]|nr:AtpZ/AtpI family protein [Candidatus Magasanikbacteria bacterium]
MSENSENKPKNPMNRYYIFALKIVGDFGATIAIPVVISAIVGQKLDAKWQTRPWLLIVFMAISALSSAYLIYKKSKIYGRQFQDLDKK